jgi:capsular polysaccharide transport system permease protein
VTTQYDGIFLSHSSGVQSQPMIVRALQAWLASVSALFVEHAITRFKRKGGIFTALLEPVAIVATVSAFHGLLGATKPPFGNSVLVFYSTGIFYHFTFMWISMQSKEAKGGLTLPRAQHLDRVLVECLLQVLVVLVAMVATFTALGLYGLQEAIPSDPSKVFLSFSVACIFGFGVALINSVILPFFRFWRLIYQISIRLTLMMSGVFFVPDFLPPYIRKWLVWMPLLHGVAWFRSGFMPNYPKLLEDNAYLIFCAAISVILGLALERATRSARGSR